MEASGNLPDWASSERGEIVQWQDVEGRWHEGPIHNEDEMLQTEHYILKLPTPEGDRYYTVHYPPSPDFDLDFEIDRIESEYSSDFA